KRDVFAVGDDVNMVAQSVEKLRAVRLRVDRLHLDALAIRSLLRTLRLGIEVHAFASLPDSGETTERAEVRERVGIDLGGLGENVFGKIAHPPAPDAWHEAYRAKVATQSDGEPVGGARRLGV